MPVNWVDINVDGQMMEAYLMYPGSGHGFHCDGRASYRHEAAKDAWGKTIAWFDRHLMV
jgi:carboxymethylenebutenolidase